MDTSSYRDSSYGPTRKTFQMKQTTATSQLEQGCSVTEMIPTDTTIIRCVSKCFRYVIFNLLIQWCRCYWCVEVSSSQRWIGINLTWLLILSPFAGELTKQPITDGWQHIDELVIKRIRFVKIVSYKSSRSVDLFSSFIDMTFSRSSRSSNDGLGSVTCMAHASSRNKWHHSYRDNRRVGMTAVNRAEYKMHKPMKSRRLRQWMTPSYHLCVTWCILMLPYQPSIDSIVVSRHSVELPSK